MIAHSLTSAEHALSILEEWNYSVRDQACSFGFGTGGNVESLDALKGLIRNKDAEKRADLIIEIHEIVAVLEGHDRAKQQHLVETQAIKEVESKTPKEVMLSGSVRNLETVLRALKHMAG